jgi:glycosyltransferase involved in cell wall biosynthesis
MRLLILTQKVDLKDSALGFFHGWIKEFSKKFETLEVICLQRGESNLPENVFVHSLGKEGGQSKIKYIWRFYQYIWKRRRKYNAVFVHMNQEYVLLGGLFWKFWGKKVIFWYNHTAGSFLTKIAMFISDKICHTSPFAFTANTKKSVKMPAGIDTKIFKLDPAVSRNLHKILYIGRIAPAKKIHILIDTVEILNKEGIDFTLNIYGDALEKDQEYFRKLKKASFDTRDKKVFFHGAVPNIETPKIFGSHLIAVNLTAKGNYDKSVLEAAACGALPLVSSKAFANILPPELFFKEDDSRDLAERIEVVMNTNQKERGKLQSVLRENVDEKESLEKLSAKILEIFS